MPQVTRSVPARTETRVFPVDGEALCLEDAVPDEEFGTIGKNKLHHPAPMLFKLLNDVVVDAAESGLVRMLPGVDMLAFFRVEMFERVV